MYNKAIIIILDGLGDRPVASLNALTPLEKAHTPNMDRLACSGLTGLVDPLKPGVPVSTHTGMALLMGLARSNIHKLARGPVEAAGINLQVDNEDVIMRCNFAHIEKDKEQFKILDRRAGRISNTKDLSAVLQDIELPHNILASVHSTTQYRAVLHLKGKELSSKITDTDAVRIVPSIIQHCVALKNKTTTKKTVDAVNYFTQKAYDILNKHPLNKQRIEQGLTPANGLICRSPGRIEEEDQANVFEKYTQFANAIHSPRENILTRSGLGLAITKELLEKLGGSISLQSIPKVGTTFTFTLPVRKNLKENELIKEDKITSESVLPMLIVEDDDINALIMTQFLTDQNHESERAADGETALEQLKTEKFSLIFMDLNMPGISGIETTEKLRQMGIETPIVGLTANATDEQKAECFEKGMNYFITKPVTPENIRKVVERHV
ncbi:MAG: response regulator [Gammaproteobacteria bacterium]|nr:response regulator [Gammaproteobacteria bacterium]